MKLTLNIDDYLSKFAAFNVSNKLLTEYNNSYYNEDEELVYNVPNYGDADLIKYKSEQYYKTLLNDKYITLSNLLTVITPKLGSLVREYKVNEYNNTEVTEVPREDYYKSWYFIADNAYHMKGNIRAVSYIFEYLGLRDYNYSYNYDRYNFEITTGLSINTVDIELAKNYITQLISELLLVTESKIKITLIIIKYNDTTKFNSTAYIRSYSLSNSKLDFVFKGDYIISDTNFKMNIPINKVSALGFNNGTDEVNRISFVNGEWAIDPNEDKNKDNNK